MFVLYVKKPFTAANNIKSKIGNYINKNVKALMSIISSKISSNNKKKNHFYNNRIIINTQIFKNSIILII